MTTTTTTTTTEQLMHTFFAAVYNGENPQPTRAELRAFALALIAEQDAADAEDAEKQRHADAAED